MLQVVPLHSQALFVIHPPLCHVESSPEKKGDNLKHKIISTSSQMSHNELQ